MVAEFIVFGALVAAATFITHYFPRKRSGQIVVSPGEEQVYVKLDYEPREIEVYFLDDGPSPPSCAYLRDEIHTIRIWPRGFKFFYVVESGVRTIEWKVTR